MKVMLINGSPHSEGCTYTALSEVGRILSEEGIRSEIFHIGTKPIGGCTACMRCGDLHRCVFDDRVNDFLALAKEADGFIFGSPVHFASAGGAITSFMDRAFYADLRGGDGRFYLKPAAAVASARRAGTTATLDQMNKYFSLMQMPIVSSQYWNMVHGASPDEVGKDLEGMQTMRVLARNMAWLLRCVESGRAAGLPRPVAEARRYTNFIRD